MKPPARPARRSRRPPAASDQDQATTTSSDAARAVSTLELEPGAALVPVAVAAPDGGDHEAAGTTPEDLFAADRFTVDPAEWGEPVDPPSDDSPPQQEPERTPPWRLLVRLLLVIALSLVAFHHSIASAAASIASGSALVYLLTVPLHAGLAASAKNRRPGYSAASGVGLLDVVVGVVLAAVALTVTTLLGPGLSGVYGLWRLDLLALWLFLLGATVLSFGLRQVARTWPFWVVLVLLWPFPVRLVNTAWGGACGGAVLLSVVVLAVLAYGHREDDPPRWQVVGSAALAATLVLLVSGIDAHPERLGLPSVAAAAVGVAWWVSRAHPSRIEAVPEPRVPGTGVALVVLAAVGLLVLPPAPQVAAPTAPTGITDLRLGPLVVPGFTTTATAVSKEQQRYFGPTSTWERVRLRQGDARTGLRRDGREVAVDVLSTGRPQALALYPVVTTYPMGTLSLTPDAVTDLGHGIRAQIYRAQDSRHGIGYTLLTFDWRLPVDMSITAGYAGPPAQLMQRITLISVDDHREGAPFPEPGNATLDGIRAAFTDVGASSDSGTSGMADAQLLSDTARRLVEQRLTGR